ncbi:hypothetical protein D3C72_1508660 [compost metagenome]
MHYLFQPNQRRPAHDAGHICLGGGAGQHNVAAIARQRRDSHGRHAHRRGVLPAQYRGARAALRYVHQHLGPKAVLRKGLPVAAFGLPVFHRTGHIGVDGLGQASFRSGFEVMQAEYLAQGVEHGWLLAIGPHRRPRCCLGQWRTTIGAWAF